MKIDQELLSKFRSASAVLLDFDGTLIDASQVICSSFNAALRKFSVAELEDSEILPLVGIPLVDMFASLKLSVPTEELIEEYRNSFSKSSLEDTILIDGASDLIEEIRNRRLAIVTSRSTGSTDKLLEFFQLRDAFSVLIGVDKVQNGKPDPEPVFLALEQMGTNREEALFVGDTPHDMIAAVRAGVVGVGVATGFHTRDELMKAGAEAVFDTLFDLRDAFRGGETK